MGSRWRISRAPSRCRRHGCGAGAPRPRRSAARSRRIRPGAKSRGNFLPRKPLKFLETRKESRRRRCWSASPRRTPIPPNPARAENRGISVAGCAPREADGKRSRREMAPQRLEKIESAPGNGMGSGASNLQDVVHGCAHQLRPIKIGLRKRWGSSGAMKGNFPPRKPLKFLETRMESRCRPSRLWPSPRGRNSQ